MKDNTVFGIDLGTTHSCIAYVDEASGQPVVVSNVEGDLTTPSVVLFEGTDRVVGKEAKNAAVMYADRVVAMVKRQMGVSGWRFPFDGQDYTAEEISSYVLRKLVADTETLLGTSVGEVVITCPAYFGTAEREATARAGEIAGLKVMAVINEPTAAAISYGIHAEGDQNVLVYDLGGGTFDVTLIEIKDGSVRVVATSGDHRLGGRDWDEAVVGYLAESWQQATGSTDDPRDSEETRQDLWQRAEDGKRTLSARTEARIMVSHDGQRVPVSLTREKFDELTGNLLLRTVEFTKSVLEIGTERGIDTVNTLLLVGGSSKMPQVTERLTKEFSMTPVMHDPDQSVAKGAAIYGQKLAIDETIKIEIEKILEESGSTLDEDNVPDDVRDKAAENVAAQEGMRKETVLKLSGTKVTDVASHSFGIVAIDDSTGTNREHIANLVLAQDPVPAKKTQSFGTVEANQTRVDIQVMENTQRERDVPLEQGHPIGIATLRLSSGLPSGSLVDITFELTSEGRLRVTGRDMADGGSEITATIETDRGLSEEELKLAKARASGVKVSG